AARVMAMAKPDCPAVFQHRGTEKGSRQAVAAVSFAVRFSPGTGPSAVVPFGLCRCLCPFATAGFVPAAADLFDPADSVDSGLAAAVAAAAAVAVVDLSAADPSVVAACPGSVGFAVFAADLASSVCPFAVASGTGMVVVAVPFCFLTHRS